MNFGTGQTTNTLGSDFFNSEGKTIENKLVNPTNTTDFVAIRSFNVTSVDFGGTITKKVEIGKIYKINENRVGAGVAPIGVAVPKTYTINFDDGVKATISEENFNKDFITANSREAKLLIAKGIDKAKALVGTAIEDTFNTLTMRPAENEEVKKARTINTVITLAAVFLIYRGLTR